MRMYLLILTVIAIVWTNAEEEKKGSLLQGVYWEVKPYIFTNDEGKLDGIIPRMFTSAQYHCMKNKNLNIIEFNKKLSSRKTFFDLLRSNDTVYGQGRFKGIQHNDIFWAPIISYIDPVWEAKNNYRSFQLMKTKDIAVIVPRHKIDLPNKILRGILSCQPIFIIATTLAILFSIAIWLIERRWNDDFDGSFIKGSATGLWWSIVSMTTVGYGDIVPRSPFGRFVAVFWLFIGVMIGCVMTATMTDVVSGISDLSVYGKKVAVLENSYEEKVAKMDYRAKIVSAQSYEEVIMLVRSNQVFAAMINSDVASWYQDEITDETSGTPLHIIEKIPANLYVKCLLSANISKELAKTFRCMYHMKDEVYTYSIEHYQRYCHTETIHIGSVSDIFKTNVFVQTLIGMVCILFILGIAFDVYVYFFVEKKQCKNFYRDTLKFYKGLLGYDTNNDFKRTDNDFQLIEKKKECE